MKSLCQPTMCLMGLVAAQLAWTDAPSAAPPVEAKIGVSVKDSAPAWPQPVRAPAGAPNIVLILLDDVGFSAASAFGGPVETPALDALASQGLRYNRFHVSALCSPTRAALLSGRNDHRAGFGQIMEATSAFPGYNGVWRKDTVMVADVLRRNGYSTAAFGKWHNTPYSEISPVGPFDRWPTGLGFEYFYGFMGGLDSHWEPSRLYRNTTPVEVATTSKQSYHLTTDIANDAINWVRTHRSLAPDKPYFLYFATGATHGPHHVSEEWIEKYRGRFRQGWDTMREESFARQKKLGIIPADAQLTPRSKQLLAWNALSKERQQSSARQMEIFAAFLSHTDHEVGRLLQTVQQGPQGDNTLVLYIVGDNGAEGYPAERATPSVQNDPEKLGSRFAPYNLYSAEWAWATSTPFQWTKFVASHLGGTRDPLVVSWPARIKHAGGVRTQYTHVNDIAPTIYEVTGITFPAVVDGVRQQPMDGVSLAYSFDAPGAPSQHRLQIFEQVGNRAIYQDGWLAGAFHMVPWIPSRPHKDFADDRWELYHLDEDFSQARDVAKRYPDKLKELQAAFHSEAQKNNVYPLQEYPPHHNSKKEDDAERREYVYYSGTPRIAAMVAPKLATSSYTISAEVNLPDNTAQGVIVSFGGRYGGFALYLKDGNLVYENQTQSGLTRDLIVADMPASGGKFVLGCEFSRRDPNSTDNSPENVVSGTVRLYIDGRPVAEKFLTMVRPDTYTGTLGIGRAFGSPVSSVFEPPFEFTGTLEKVTVRLQ